MTEKINSRYLNNMLILRNSNSEFYKYYLKNPDHLILKELIDNNNLPISYMESLTMLYELLIKNNHLELILDIIKNNKKNIDTVIMFQISINNDWKELIKTLILNGYDLNISYNEGDHDLLMYTLLHKTDLNMVKYLIKKGMTITKDKLKKLRYYTSKMYNIIDYILEMDLSTDTWEELFILYCSYKKYQSVVLDTNIIVDIILKLLEKNININILNNEENLYNFYQNCSPRIYQVLSDNGLSTNSNSPLFYACHYENYVLAEYLLDHGMKFDNNILQIMFININNDMLDLLLKYQIDLSNLPLPPIVYESDFNIKVKKLELNNGLDINVLIAYLVEQNNELNNSELVLSKKIMKDRKIMDKLK